jgi:hypothetical protein
MHQILVLGFRPESSDKKIAKVFRATAVPKVQEISKYFTYGWLYISCRTDFNKFNLILEKFTKLKTVLLITPAYR